MEKIQITELGQEFSIFGGKGDVWGNTSHIYQSGNGLLCGTPALSTNWSRLEGVTEIGCPRCIEKYKQEVLKQTLGFEFEKG